MGKPNDVKDQFARLLKEALTAHFGKMPAVAVVTREFNLRAHGVEPVTQESVRRWLKGISMPEERKLRILTSWLRLDLARCFGGLLQADGMASNGNGRGNGNGQGNGNGNDGAKAQDGHQRLVTLIAGLPPAERRMLEQLAETLALAGKGRGRSV